MSTEQELHAHEFRLGIFSIGDIIALGGVLFMSGSLWFQVGQLQKENDRIVSRIQALEQIVPTNYVRRDEYRDDIREVKALLQQINIELKSKVDK